MRLSDAKNKREYFVFFVSLMVYELILYYGI